MKIAPVAQVKARLSGYIEECRRTPVIITRNGRPTAVLVAVPEDDDELERFVLAYTPRFRALLDAAMERIEESGGLSHEDVWPSSSRRKAAKRR